MKDKSYAGFFLEGWYVFDNFSAFQIEWRGKLYPTAEHAYQAAHFIETSPEIAEKVRNLKSPREASDFANENSALEDPMWKQKRLDIMREIIRCKLDQHEYVRQKLIESADMNIVEMNDNDGFWGWGKGHDGANNLGKYGWSFAARFCNSAHLYSVSRSLAEVKYEYYGAECGVFAMLRRFLYFKFL